MQQYQVPQFITIEDKIFGPLTFKQFLYLGGGAVISVFAYTALEQFLFFMVAIPIMALAAALAFLKINDQPFPKIFLNAVKFFLKPRLYLWKKIEEKEMAKTPIAPETKETMLRIPKLSESKLTDLAWSLDIQEKLKR